MNRWRGGYRRDYTDTYDIVTVGAGYLDINTSCW
jgi:hypothetical protein